MTGHFFQPKFFEEINQKGKIPSFTPFGELEVDFNTKSASMFANFNSSMVLQPSPISFFPQDAYIDQGYVG